MRNASRLFGAQKHHTSLNSRGSSAYRKSVRRRHDFVAVPILVLLEFAIPLQNAAHETASGCFLIVAAPISTICRKVGTRSWSSRTTKFWGPAEFRNQVVEEDAAL